MDERQSSKTRLIAGAMSGTSADGVDVAITEITGHALDMRCRLVHHHHRPYSQALRNEIFAFRGGDASANLARLANLGRDISLTYAAAVNEALVASHLTAAELAGVAAHGQTLYHDPPNTIQWFDPSLVAAEVGCPVISDFRRADLAAGGQGAPLVPFADYILFRDPAKSRVLLNIGGIANITILGAGGAFNDVIAFDTGPGNCICDYLCRQYDERGPGFDASGALASKGEEIDGVWTYMSNDPYFAKPPPKSTDGPAMIDAWERALAHVGGEHSLPDLLCTACGATAGSILDAIERVCGKFPDEIVVSGGGTQNNTLMSMMGEVAKDRLFTCDSLGVAADAKEALAFALLGAATLDGVPSNVPSVTGARRAVVLGSITPKP